MTVGASSADDFIIITKPLEAITEDPARLGEELRQLTFASQEPGWIKTFVLRPGIKPWKNLRLSTELMWYFEEEDLPAHGDPYQAGGCSYRAGGFIIDAMWWEDQETVLAFHIRRGDKLMRRILNLNSASPFVWVDQPVPKGK